MKKLFIAIGLVLLLAGAGVTWLLLNLDSLAKQVIETAGTRAMGTEVSVGTVDIDLMNGNAGIADFRVANPEGFSNEDMMRFDALTVDIALGSIGSEIIRINSVRSTNPYVLYELQGGRTNLDVVREHLASGRPADTEPPPEAARELMLSIGEIAIEGIRGRLQADRLPRSVDVDLGTIVLRDMEGTPTDIARQIARPLLTQVSANAASALVNATGELLEGELTERAEQAAEELRNQARSRLQDTEQQVDDTMQETAEDLGNRLRDAFNR
ncbi:MAG: hypothetical protein WEB57_08490 [Pseudohongiellaceae bacterium]